MPFEKIRTPALNAAVDETVRLAAVRERRERRKTTLIVLGIIWSFIYTSAALVLIVSLYRADDSTCEGRQAGREAVRTLLVADPDTDVLLLEQALPPIECH